MIPATEDTGLYSERPVFGNQLPITAMIRFLNNLLQLRLKVHHFNDLGQSYQQNVCRQRSGGSGWNTQLPACSKAGVQTQLNEGVLEARNMSINSSTRCRRLDEASDYSGHL